VLVLLTVLTGVRMDQVARSMRRLERSQRDARQHARQTQRSLQVTLDELHNRERSDAQRQQRDRLLRELHDDIGQRVARAIALTQPTTLTGDGGLRNSQHGALRAAESGSGTLAGRGALTRTVQLQGLLDSALLDLRLVLSSLDRGNPVLADALIDMCRHIEPLMHVRGARLQWRMAVNTTRLRIGAAETLQMLRIAQEVLVEVLHAQDNAGDASVALELVIAPTGRQLRLQICAGTASSAGSDSLTMPGPLCVSPDWTRIHQRAKVLGAVVAVAQQPEGWGLEICLPLGPVTPAAT
jgi:signal transduction histidine kinase